MMRIKILFFMVLCYTAVSAQRPRLTLAEDSVFSLHGKEFIQQIMSDAKEAMIECRMRSKMTNEQAEKLQDYFTIRDIKKRCYNYIYPKDLRKRISEKMRIDLLYRDSIDMILVAALGSKVTGDNINRILFHEKGMKLDSIQYGIIMDKALDMAHRLHDDPRIDVWDEEMKLISKTLNGKQQKLFFHLKNNTVVNRDIDTGWERLKNAGLTEQLDSAKETNLAYDYYHEMYRIKDLYRYHGTSQRKYLAELNKHKPMMVKMLDGLDKKAAVTEEEEKNGTVGKEFVW